MELRTGKDLKKWRKENHMTQADVAKKTHYTISRIGQIECHDLPISKKLRKELGYVEQILLHQSSPVTEALNRVRSDLKLKDYMNEMDYLEEIFSDAILKIQEFDSTEMAVAYLFYLISAVENINLAEKADEKEDEVDDFLGVFEDDIGEEDINDPPGWIL